MRSRTRILVVDNHPIERMGIRFCLAGHSHLHIVGEAADGPGALAKARALLPDIVLLDIDLPQMSGLGVAQVLHKDFPNMKVLILSMCQRPEYMPRILQSGARGYVLKTATPEQLVKAIETVGTGGCYFSPNIARLALKPYGAELSSREREVLIRIAEGFSNKEIAKKLNISVRTVQTHRAHIMRKLGLHNVAGLTWFALAKGLSTLRDAVAR